MGALARLHAVKEEASHKFEYILPRPLYEDICNECWVSESPTLHIQLRPFPNWRCTGDDIDWMHALSKSEDAQTVRRRHDSDARQLRGPKLGGRVHRPSIHPTIKDEIINVSSYC
jgi:hypothetical protein